MLSVEDEAISDEEIDSLSEVNDPEYLQFLDYAVKLKTKAQ